MRVVSVQIGKIKTLEWNGRAIRTAIAKEPVEGPVGVTRLRMQGDCQANLQVHGGIHKAVYTYPLEHYALWAQELGRAIAAPGAYGENLTLEGLLETEACIGDKLRIGSALFEISEPREPCFKLEAWMRHPGFGRLMIANRRCGFYLRVLEEGSLIAGDTVERVWSDPAQVQVAELFPLMVSSRNLDLNVAQRALQIESLSPRLNRRMQRIVSGISVDDE